MGSDTTFIDQKVDATMDELRQHAFRISGGDSAAAQMEFERLKGDYLTGIRGYDPKDRIAAAAPVHQEISTAPLWRIPALLAVTFGIALSPMCCDQDNELSHPESLQSYSIR